jgi:hypothetical protein
MYREIFHAMTQKAKNGAPLLMPPQIQLGDLACPYFLPPTSPATLNI